MLPYRCHGYECFIRGQNEPTAYIRSPAHQVSGALGTGLSCDSDMQSLAGGDAAYAGQHLSRYCPRSCGECIGQVAPPPPAVQRPPNPNCVDTPRDWASSTGNSCGQYESANWCTVDGGYGPGWLTGKLFPHADTFSRSHRSGFSGGFLFVLQINTALSLGGRLMASMRHKPVVHVAEVLLATMTAHLHRRVVAHLRHLHHSLSVG
jgi:hypothetical protein